MSAPGSIKPPGGDPKLGETVLVLGAGPLQAPLIAAARRAGHRVIALDNVPGNVGHRLAHASIDASTRDIAAVVSAARRLGVTAIATAASDVAVPALAASCAELGLPGPSRETCAAFHGKESFREFQRKAGLAHPAFVAGSDARELAHFAGSLSGPVVVKPTDRSGSRGVTRLGSPRASELTRAIERALAISFEGRACVEQALPGVEYGGDGVVLEGRIEFLAVTHKQMQGTVVRGHVVPSGLGEAPLATIRRELERHVRAARYEAGPLNFDLMLGPDGEARIIELSPRLGGNWIPQLVARAYGVDLFGSAIEIALGRTPQLRPQMPSAAASFVLASEREGRLARPLSLDAVRAQLPQLVALELDAEVGTPISPLRDSAQQVGRALFDLAGTSFRAAASTLDAALADCLEGVA